MLMQGLHGLVVGVAGPFHDDVGSDAHGEGVNDEGAAACMGAGEFPLRPKWRQPVQRHPETIRGAVTLLCR